MVPRRLSVSARSGQPQRRSAVVAAAGGVGERFQAAVAAVAAVAALAASAVSPQLWQRRQRWQHGSVGSGGSDGSVGSGGSVGSVSAASRQRRQRQRRQAVSGACAAASSSSAQSVSVRREQAARSIRPRAHLALGEEGLDSTDANKSLARQPQCSLPGQQLPANAACTGCCTSSMVSTATASAARSAAAAGAVDAASAHLRALARRRIWCFCRAASKHEAVGVW